ncbi:MAG: peptidase M29 [Paracoccaceae bacterium]|nr:peptidase M29 [Paracoccaceae bacterium]MDE2911728.1 peptidase M29 [Paracoccaceae bacterium]
MLTEPLENCWIDAFADVFELSKVGADESVVVLAETGSRQINLQVAELALARLGLKHFRITIPSPSPPAGPVIRSTGASLALHGQENVVSALACADVVIDLTVEGLMHAPQTRTILSGGARILTVSNEHPDILARTVPTPDLKDRGRDAVARCRAARVMTVQSASGTDLTVSMKGSTSVGVWGWTDRPGTLAHWPGGLVACFPGASSVNGRLAYRPGDMNLTFKRYFESAVDLRLEDDYVTAIEGSGTDAALMRDYLAGFGDRHAYATSHVGWGFNPHARYEALAMYDRCDSNGTELRTLAGNFLFSTGANEFANRFTRGHFDLPMMGCDIALDDMPVVTGGCLT